MSIDAYIETTFPVQCKGRDKDMKEVLKEPVEVKVKVYKSPGSNMISSIVECPYNIGGHGQRYGQRCKASHPGVDWKGKGISCVYSFDLPYALEQSYKTRKELDHVNKERFAERMKRNSQRMRGRSRNPPCF